MATHASFLCFIVHLSLYLLFTLAVDTKQSQQTEPGLFTCKGKCGQVLEMPCSCDLKCLVYKNCCENMTYDCPNILKTSRSEYGHLLDAEVICHESGVFMISSCPQNLNKKRRSILRTILEKDNVTKLKLNEKKDGHRRSDPTTEINDRNKVKEINGGLTLNTTSFWTMETLEKTALKDLELTRWDKEMENEKTVGNDRTSFEATAEEKNNKNKKPVHFLDKISNDFCATPAKGSLTFGSKSESEKPIKTSTEESKTDLIQAIRNAPVVDKETGLIFSSLHVFLCLGGNETNNLQWEVSLSSCDSGKLADLKSFEDIEVSQQLVYSFPINVSREFAGRPCYPNLPRQCAPGTDIELEDMCQNFASYVEVKVGDFSQIFTNRFCYQCNQFYDESNTRIKPLMTKFVRARAKFSVFLSIQEKYLKLFARGQLPRFIWEEATCPVKVLEIDGRNAQEDDPKKKKCTISICRNNYKLQQDGQCKVLYNLTLGIADDGFPLSEVELENLSQFFNCSLHNFLGLKVFNVSDSNSKFDRRLARVLYFNNLQTYMSTSVFESYNTLVKIAIIAKSLIYCKDPSRVVVCRSNGTISPQNLITTSRTSIQTDNEAADSGVEVIATYDLFSSRKDLREFFISKRGKVIENTTTVVCLRSEPVSEIIEQPAGMYCWKDLVHENDEIQIRDFLNTSSSCFSILYQNKPINQAVQMLMSWTMMTVSVITVLVQEL